MWVCWIRGTLGADFAQKERLSKAHGIARNGNAHVGSGALASFPIMTIGSFVVVGGVAVMLPLGAFLGGGVANPAIAQVALQSVACNLVKMVECVCGAVLASVRQGLHCRLDDLG